MTRCSESVDNEAHELSADEVTIGHIAVLVLGYNDCQWLERCLSSLLQTNYGDFSIIFVDNASSDGSTEFVEARFPEVAILTNRTNLGYAGGNNSGIRYAIEHNADCVVLLNPDTWVEPNWLTELAKVFAADQSIGVATALIQQYDDSSLDYNCLQILRSIPECVQNLWEGELRPWYYTDSGSGAALAVKREFFEAVGAIDPEFFMYFEEIDLLRRGRYHGYRMAISTRGIVHHYNHLEHPEEHHRPTKIRFERGHMIFTLKNQFEPVAKSIVKFALEGPSRITGALLAHHWKRARLLVKVTVELWVKSPLILWRRSREKFSPNTLPEMQWLLRQGRPASSKCNGASKVT